MQIWIIAMLSCSYAPCLFKNTCFYLNALWFHLLYTYTNNKEKLCFIVMMSSELFWLWQHYSTQACLSVPRSGDSTARAFIRMKAVRAANFFQCIMVCMQRDFFVFSECQDLCIPAEDGWKTPSLQITLYHIPIGKSRCSYSLFRWNK